MEHLRHVTALRDSLNHALTEVTTRAHSCVHHHHHKLNRQTVGDDGVDFVAGLQCFACVISMIVYT